MKVWELIAELSQYRANMEVMVSLPNLQSAKTIQLEHTDDETVTIAADDTQFVNDQGDECGWLSGYEPTT